MRQPRCSAAAVRHHAILTTLIALLLIPAISAGLTSPSPHQGTKSTSRFNPERPESGDGAAQPPARALTHQLPRRQVACPQSPALGSACPGGYCLGLSSTTPGAHTWSTCCPAGWNLLLTGTDGWSRQRCCPATVTQAQCEAGAGVDPLAPTSCGALSGVQGVLSNWGCVYGAGLDQEGNGEFIGQGSGRSVGFVGGLVTVVAVLWALLGFS